MECRHTSGWEFGTVAQSSGWWELIGDRRAVTSVEYALIGALIFVVIVLGITQLGSNLQTTFGTFANNL
jgi:pilus assembly protein Flp/PilA